MSTRNRYSENDGLPAAPRSVQPPTRGAKAIITSIIGMVFLVVLSLLLDFWTRSIGDLRASSGSFEITVLYTYTLASILFAMSALTLFWYVVVKIRRNLVIIILFLALGLFMYVYPLLFFSGFIFWRELFDYLTPGAHVYMAGAILLATGILNLTLPSSSD